MKTTNTTNTTKLDLTVGRVAKLVNTGIERAIVSVNNGWVELYNQQRKVRISEIESTREPKSYNMTKHITPYREGYTTARTSTGRKTKICNDPLSIMLLALTPIEVITLAENLLDRDGLKDKYQNLNEGQKRMNAGNLIRNAIKREEMTTEEVEDAITHAWHVAA